MLWWDVAVKNVLWATVQLPSDHACNLYFLAVYALCVVHKGMVALSSSPAGIRPCYFISQPFF